MIGSQDMLVGMVHPLFATTMGISGRPAESWEAIIWFAR
jgi:hypothetical protein